MSIASVFANIPIKTSIFAACLGVFLAQTALADGFSHEPYDLARANHNSVISISTRESSYGFSVSTWHMSRRHGQHEHLAPKAKIIDVQDALANSACAYQHGVCILRTSASDAL